MCPKAPLVSLQVFMGRAVVLAWGHGFQMQDWRRNWVAHLTNQILILNWVVHLPLKVETYQFTAQHSVRKVLVQVPRLARIPRQHGAREALI